MQVRRLKFANNPAYTLFVDAQSEPSEAVMLVMNLAGDCIQDSSATLQQAKPHEAEIIGGIEARGFYLQRALPQLELIG